MNTMKKSALGIPNGIAAALIFLAAYLNSTALIILLIFVALKEEDAFVKASAKRAAIIFIAYYAIDVALSLLTGIPYIFTSSLGVFGTLVNKIDSIAFILFKVLLLCMGGLALIDQTVKDTVFDVAAVETKKCPKCGAELDKNAKFCNKCGEQM